MKNLTPWERKAKFSEIKSVFYDFVINVPIPWNETAINFDSEKINNFYVSDLENPSRFYLYSEDNFKIFLQDKITSGFFIPNFLSIKLISIKFLSTLFLYIFIISSIVLP